MCKPRLTRNFAWTLLGVYVLFGLSWIAHYGFSPQHRHDGSSCERHDSGGKPVSGDAQCDSDCLLCYLSPTAVEVSGIPVFTALLDGFENAKPGVGESVFCAEAATATRQPRAPPFGFLVDGGLSSVLIFS
ncbi:MAG: hypothetical protein ACK4NS_11085 [Saprospiraceae bacterium]